MPLPKVRLLRFAVTPRPVATLELANVPDNTLPVKVEASAPSRPLIVGAPLTTALVLPSYCLLVATKPLMVTGACVMLDAAVIAPVPMA